MAIRSAKHIIREARIQSGLTQKEMADGICSLQALSRIECGSANVSPATFDALMRRAGFPHTRFPVFVNRADFECYRSLKYARIHLDAWQLAPAWEELQKLKTLNWAGNKFYYQEWLFLYGRLQFRSYSCCHEHIYSTLLAALRITRPHFTPDNLSGCLLTENELEIVTALAQETLYLGNREECAQMLDNIENCLDNSSFSSMEKARLQAEAAIVRVKYLLSVSEYENAFRLADEHRHQMVLDDESAPLFELTFLAGLCLFHSAQGEEADSLIKSAYYTAHHVDSCYASVCLDYLQRETSFPVTKQMLRLPGIPLEKYPEETFDTSLPFLSETGSTDKVCNYTIGDIIRDFRMEQELSQQTLCYGLCSKSKLSKVEGKTLQPDIALTEALLQRLGISERIFTFWGSEREAKYYDLKFGTMHVRSLKQRELILKDIESMESLSTEKDILRRQECLASKALLNPSPEAIPLLAEALHLTLPDFDIHQILSYRLTWQELSILNNIAHLYGYSNSGESYKSSLYFLQLLKYQQKTPLDIQMCVNTFSVTGYMYCHSLYGIKHFNEIITLPERSDLLIMRYDMNALMMYLFYYCRALGKCQQYEQAALYAVFACNTACLREHNKTISLLKSYLAIDFDISISY